jgi:outer membrane protein assembly factor BamB
VRADLVADEFGVYVASTDTTLYVLDRTNGKIRWRYMAQQPLEASPFVTADRVYLIVPEFGLVALDKLQGKLFREPLWTSPGVKQILSADNRRVYVLTESGQALALDKLTGQIRYQADMNEYDLFTTNRRDATVYAATKAGKLVAFKPTESRLK